ncbi:hypothetical protein ACOJUR_09000 [Alicyclobacillus tolerans]|uniref:hypothetical protein n=1 Tax=Alicyclobacillus tolerans TaxID=90970 RepID=UPI003B7D610D
MNKHDLDGAVSQYDNRAVLYSHAFCSFQNYSALFGRSKTDFKLQLSYFQGRGHRLIMAWTRSKRICPIHWPIGEKVVDVYAVEKEA